ncbi:hypothetical protein PFISCL1PPCAC_28517, partial [Pristionchus fissidentatus]
VPLLDSRAIHSTLLNAPSSTKSPRITMISSDYAEVELSSGRELSETVRDTAANVGRYVASNGAILSGNMTGNGLPDDFFRHKSPLEKWGEADHRNSIRPVRQDVLQEHRDAFPLLNVIDQIATTAARVNVAPLIADRILRDDLFLSLLHSADT